MLPTPLYRLTEEQRDTVYDPAEDTFLLLDALEKDLEQLSAAKPLIALEIGCGAGVVSTFLAMRLGSNCFCFATDINPFAVECAQETAAMNQAGNFAAVQCDLSSAFEARLAHAVDVLVFNPPYVPTTAAELRRGQDDGGVPSAGDLLSRSWAGGPSGRVVLDRLLPRVPQLLSATTGRFYLVAVEENDVPQLCTALEPAMKAEIVLERRSGQERLYVLRYMRR